VRVLSVRDVGSGALAILLSALSMTILSSK